VMVCRHIPSIFGAVGQSEILQLLRKTGAPMSPVDAASQLSGLEAPEIEFELRLHELEITAAQHRPVDQPLVLRRHRSPAPVPEIRRSVQRAIHQGRIIGKQSAIEFRGLGAIGITPEHIPEQLVITPYSPLGGCAIADANKAAFPKIPPPPP